MFSQNNSAVILVLNILNAVKNLHTYFFFFFDVMRIRTDFYTKCSKTWMTCKVYQTCILKKIYSFNSNKSFINKKTITMCEKVLYSNLFRINITTEHKEKFYCGTQVNIQTFWKKIRYNGYLTTNKIIQSTKHNHYS